MIKNSGVDAAEIGMMLEVAVVELIETRVLSNQTRLNLATDQEYGGGSTMISS